MMNFAGEIMHLNDTAYDDLIREGSRGVNAIKLLKEDGWSLYSKTEWQSRGLLALRKLYRERVAYFHSLMETQDEIPGALFMERVKNFTTGLWRQTKPLLMTAPAWTNRMMLDSFETLGLQVKPKPREPPVLTAAQKKLHEQKVRQKAAKNSAKDAASRGKKKRSKNSKDAMTGKVGKVTGDRTGKPLTGFEVLVFLEHINGRLQAVKGLSIGQPGEKGARSLFDVNAAKKRRPGTAEGGHTLLQAAAGVKGSEKNIARGTLAMVGAARRGKTRQQALEFKEGTKTKERSQSAGAARSPVRKAKSSVF